MAAERSVQEGHLSVGQADECYKRALRRLAVCFNAGKGGRCSRNWLSNTDQELEKVFVDRNLDSELISYLLSARLEGVTGANLPPNDVRAEHEFYGQFQFQRRQNPSRLHISFDSTEAFREWSMKRLHQPESNDPALQDYFRKSPVAAFSEAFTNYLVKNFWHNTVHTRLQTITSANFHAFGGDARYESDFVADNVANISLLRSYGCTVAVKGKALALHKQNQTQHLFAMNRCNRVFAERAEQRNEQLDQLEAFQERLWRFKRQLANQLSMKLLSEGAGVADIAIYLTGGIKRGRAKGEPYYHGGHVVVRLNQRYYSTGLAPYLADAGAQGLSPDRVVEIRSRLRNRMEEIVTSCKARYIADLKADISLRSYATDVLAAQEAKLCAF